MRITICTANIPPDSKAPIEELCRTAIQKGFQEIAITDHFELYAPGYPVGFFTPRYVEKVLADIESAQKKFEGQLIIRKGIGTGPADGQPGTGKVHSGKT